MPANSTRGPLTERVFAVLNRDPLDAPNQARTDLLVAGVVGVLGATLAVGVPGAGLALDALGWAMFAAITACLIWRRRHPVGVLLVMVVLVATYHALDYSHAATTPATMVALYTLAVTGPPLRAALLGSCIVCVTLTVMLLINTDRGIEMLRTSGWIVAVLVIGMDVRVYRKYIAAVVERAERAERDREKEAARRVAEERLRIARDLHDLLAHSITLIGVQTSVASHVLTVDPERLDRAAIAQALDGISDTCREARSELRTTLEVLRTAGTAEGDDGNWAGALPDLAALSGLVEAARTGGAETELSVRTEGVRVPPVAEAAAYRIVQESLTNAVRHAGPAPRVQVQVETRAGALHVTVTDNGGALAGRKPPAEPGYGIVGMRERARSVGGTLDARPYDEGFRVSAVLPLGERTEPPETESRHTAPGDERRLGAKPPLSGTPTPPKPGDGSQAGVPTGREGPPTALAAPAGQDGRLAGPAASAEAAVPAGTADPVGPAGPPPTAPTPRRESYP
ncbi:sensor histidine kinase [Streptomyces niveus]|uniref:sensor histidine kinase n=1 Tax=Streptomyces niveus TaxID=193462 RepID=UPI0036946E46